MNLVLEGLGEPLTYNKYASRLANPLCLKIPQSYDFFWGIDSFLLRRVGVCGEMMTKQFANIITTFRILGTIVLLFFPLFSSEFYITYLLCGFYKMIAIGEAGGNRIKFIYYFNG